MPSLRIVFVFLVFTLPFVPPINAQIAPEPIPGAHIPNDSIPWAVDTYQGKQEIVPVHHTGVIVNNHFGANMAGALTQSFFYKPKMTIEVQGTHAQVSLHTSKPIFYIRIMSDPGGNPSSDVFANIAIVHAVLKKDRRVFSQIKFTQLTGHAKRNDSQVDAVIEKLADGWLKITPTNPMLPGEYAIQPIAKDEKIFSSVVFDFSIDPDAPNAPDAVSATVAQGSLAKP